MDWRAKSIIIHETVHKRWKPWSEEDIRFLTLALCGEAGEVAEYFIGIGVIDEETGLVEQIAEELADCRIYLCLIEYYYNFKTTPPDLRLVPGPQEAALLLCARTGILANAVKKVWRGDAGNFKEQITTAIAMIVIAINAIANALGIDLDEACGKKTEWLLTHRWPEVRPIIEERERIAKADTARL